MAKYAGEGWVLRKGTLTLTGDRIPDLPREVLELPSLNRLRLHVPVVGACSLRTCRNLQEIFLGDEVQEIGRNAFSDMKSLRKVTFGGGLREIGDHAFCSCLKLQEILFSDGGPRVIGRRAFSFCKSLRQVRLPEGLVELGENAFAACAALTQVIVPDSLTHFDPSMFEECVSLEKIEISQEHPTLSEENGFVMDRGKTRLLYVLSSMKGTCTVPERITELYDDPFRSAYQLREVILPKGLENLSPGSFYQRPALERIVFPAALRSVPKECCANCTGLREIVLPDGLQEIQDSAFANTALTEVTLPASLEQMGYGCFRGAPISRIRLLGDNLELLNFRENKILQEEVALQADCIPMDQLTPVLRRAVLKDFAIRCIRKEPVPEERDQECVAALRKHRRSLWEIQLFQDVYLSRALLPAEELPKLLEKAEKKGDQALQERLLKYRRQNVPSEVIKRQDEIKRKQELLRQARTEPTAAELRRIWKCQKYGDEGCRVFLYEYAGEDTDITVPAVIGRSKIVAIGGFAFRRRGRAIQGYSTLRSIVLPEGVVRICECAFSFCGDLEHVQLPDSLEEIEKEAFMGCGSLTELTIPAGVKRIGGGAFADCYQLMKLTILGKDTQLWTGTSTWMTALVPLLTVYAPAGSPAEAWAKLRGFKFKPL